MEEIATAFGIRVRGSTLVFEHPPRSSTIALGAVAHFCTSSPYNDRRFYDSFPRVSGWSCDLCRRQTAGVWHIPGAGRNFMNGADICTHCLPEPERWAAYARLRPSFAHSHTSGGAMASSAVVEPASAFSDVVKLTIAGQTHSLRFRRNPPLAGGATLEAGQLLQRGELFAGLSFAFVACAAERLP